MEDRRILILNGLGGTPGVIRTPDPLLRRRAAATRSIYFPFSSRMLTRFRGFCFRSKLIPFSAK
jgi:hypothetical protein